MAFDKPVALDGDTVYYIHVQAVEVPEFIFTVTVPASGADKVPGKDKLVQQLVNHFSKAERWQVTAAEKRVVSTLAITPEDKTDGGTVTPVDPEVKLETAGEKR